MTLCAMLSLASATVDREAYILAARVVFVQNVYLTTYGKRLPFARARAIVGWCRSAANLHGVSEDWLLALAARERGFLNTESRRRGDGHGYMQITVDRARMLEPRLRDLPDVAVEQYLILNPGENIRLAAKFLKQLSRESRTWRDAVCKYNVGPAGDVNGKAAQMHWAAVDRYHRALVSSWN